AAALPRHRARIDPPQGLTARSCGHTLTDMTASTRRIGSLTVSSLGLGAIPLSTGRGEPAPPDRAMAAIHAALDARITMLDTADTSCPTWTTTGRNENLVCDALPRWGGDRPHVLAATQGRIARSAEGGGRDGSAADRRTALEKSLTALGTESGDPYY